MVWVYNAGLDPLYGAPGGHTVMQVILSKYWVDEVVVVIGACPARDIENDKIILVVLGV
jgi:hypothetical protein